jgi:transcription antitermination protein NusB
MMDSTLPPKKFRELTFQLLFSCDMNQGMELEAIPLLMHELCIAKSHIKKAYERAECIWQKRALLDKTIEQNVRDYPFERIQPIEKNVLRLSLYELLLEKTEGRAVIISEALRLTEKFGTGEAVSFVHALLSCCHEISLSGGCSP